MKSKPKEKNRKATDHRTQRYWHEMNRKQRRETIRKIQSEDLSLEVVHPDASRFGRLTGASPVQLCQIAVLSLLATLPQ